MNSFPTTETNLTLRLERSKGEKTSEDCSGGRAVREREREREGEGGREGRMRERRKSDLNRIRASSHFVSSLSPEHSKTTVPSSLSAGNLVPEELDLVAYFG